MSSTVYSLSEISDYAGIKTSVFEGVNLFFGQHEYHDEKNLNEFYMTVHAINTASGYNSEIGVIKNHSGKWSIVIDGDITYESKQSNRRVEDFFKEIVSDLKTRGTNDFCEKAAIALYSVQHGHSNHYEIKGNFEKRMVPGSGKKCTMKDFDNWNKSLNKRIKKIETGGRSD